MLTVLLMGLLTIAFDIQPVRAEPKTWTVDDDGPADFHKIQEAIDAANPGDIIFVKAGTYYENIVINKDNLTLIGERKISIIDGGFKYENTVGITANNVTVIGFTITKSGPYRSGIWLNYVNNCRILNNDIIENHYNGISLYQSFDNIISGNNIADNQFIGINIQVSSENEIYHNNFLNNAPQVYYHLTVNVWDDGYPSGGNYWSDHTCSGNPSDGSQPYIINADNIDRYPFQDPNGWLKVHNINTGLNYTTIQEAIDAPETEDGQTIEVDAGVYQEHVTIYKSLTLFGENKSTTVIRGGRAGITITADNVVITGFTILNGAYAGIELLSDGCTISDNIVMYNGEGVYLQDSSDNFISDNFVMVNDNSGIHTRDSSNNTIIRNMIGGIEGVRISRYGLYLFYSSNTAIIENIIITNERGIRAEYSSNNLISQNYITLNFDFGISFYQSPNNTIIRNVIENSSTPGKNLLLEGGPGITFQDSHLNRIIQNNITNNYIGIAVASSCLNTISGNNVSSNDYVGIRFDYPWTNYNEVSGNIVSNNDYGIFLASSANNNTIFGNDIENNNRGAYLSGTSYNMFFHNNFISNTQQVVSYDSTNLWDDGYPSGGNYWSDYTGVDLYGGPSQDIPGSDGIGDTSYGIDIYNVDHYPLMNPYGAPPPQTYNLAITTTAGGTTNPSPGTYSYTANSTIQVTAIPEADYLFKHWELDNIDVGSANPYTVLMDKDHTLKAVFSPAPAVPVGGYSIPIQAHTKAEPIIPYIALIAILTTIFAEVKRKTKRKH